MPTRALLETNSTLYGAQFCSVGHGMSVIPGLKDLGEEWLGDCTESLHVFIKKTQLETFLHISWIREAAHTNC